MPEPTADTEGVDKPEPAAPAPTHTASTVIAATEPGEADTPPLTGRRRKWATAAYSVGLVAIVATAIGLGAYEANADRWPVHETAVPAGYGPPVDWDSEEVLDLVNPAVLTDADATTTEQGVIVTGQATATAAAQPQLLARQIANLTQNSCASNVNILTPDNLKIDSWGYCFASLPQEQLAAALGFALDNEAAAISFSNHPPEPAAKTTITWMPTTERDYDLALESWARLAAQRPAGWVALVIYGAGETAGYMDYADIRDDEGLVLGDNSSNSRAEELGMYAADREAEPAG